MKNILVTNVGGDGENVIIFGVKEVTKEMVEAILRTLDFKYTDISYINEDECKYYIYEPITATEEWEQLVINQYKRLAA